MGRSITPSAPSTRNSSARSGRRMTRQCSGPAGTVTCSPEGGCAPAGERAHVIPPKNPGSRLRYTPEQAEAEAKRLAEAYVAQLQNVDGYIFRRAWADGHAAKSPSTKLPVVWHAMFSRDYPEGVVVDGGELVVVVNIETK